jgi:hypothetical protein
MEIDCAGQCLNCREWHGWGTGELVSSQGTEAEVVASKVS